VSAIAADFQAEGSGSCYNSPRQTIRKSDFRSPLSQRNAVRLN
jgi:hypothetical protein